MADQHIPQLTNDPSLGPCENEFAIIHRWFIDTWTPNEWDGNAINQARFYSDTPGTQAEIVAPVQPDGNGPHVTNTFWRDINNTGALIIATDGTNVDGGNNFGILFGVMTQQNKVDSRCYIGEGIGI